MMILMDLAIYGSCGLVVASWSDGLIGDCRGDLFVDIGLMVAGFTEELGNSCFGFIHLAGCVVKDYVE